MRTACCLVLMALATLAGCSKPTTEGVDGTLVVYSLDPSFERKPEPGEEWFGKRFVLGSVSVTDAELRKKLLTEVRAGIDQGRGQPAAACMFEPRHGLRHLATDGTVTDYVICFKCGDAVVETNGRRVQGMSQTTRRAQKLLNDTLRNAGVELASGADKGE
jgi:hypothetical protein